ncbi:zona occludens toxin [Vibrio crassostreae]|uniref:zonular occludens toxin domain-containing protein n=1 Tax=Vibrio crassostreae TaxID=246167 RepID=UPI000F48193C|nr:zonular occludens toxin domain-containing protein [Vibrio crassostreae]ROR79892.1 zona occludens toxin [Vibrio crassostreae]TQL39901.1 zona occludens toxin [Vibrio crassostreae]
MAITIRTGANGSYKSAYTAYFSIYQALKAGRTVVTNIEGMQPLAVIEERFNIQFPSTAKLFRISSRDESGVHLWTHFFCWCPIGALIVIDECQDIFSKNVGFDIRKVKYKPLSDFITQSPRDGLLPKDYERFFNSRYTPANMDELQDSEIDDRGIAEYDSEGRIIYPHSFNEGFMRHRKYDWDIELLSPDWKQIDSGIKACANQNFFHKGRDQFFWTKRNPYILKHDKSVSTPVIPKKKDVNLTNQKIPLDSFLLYKSTGTGSAKQQLAMNTLFRSPKAILVFLLSIFCLGYIIYDLSNRYFETTETVEEAGQTTSSTAVPKQSETLPSENSEASGDVRSSGDSSKGTDKDSLSHVPIAEVLPFEGIKKAYVTGINFAIKRGAIEQHISIEVEALDGLYYVNENFLKAYNVTVDHIDDCLLKLNRGQLSKLITCKPYATATALPEVSRADVSLF